MAYSPQAKKRARQAVKRRKRIVGVRSMMRTALKKLHACVQKGDQESAKLEYAAVVKILDRLANRGLIHANKAARHKSRYNKHIKAMQAA